MRRYSDLLKTLGIMLLSVSALFLVMLSVFTQPERLSGDLYVRTEAPSLRWLGISGITSYDGTERLGAVYLPETGDDCISALSEGLSRAMNTAGATAPAAESDWLIALATRCVHLTFREALPAEIIWSAFGAGNAPDLDVSAIILTPDTTENTAKLLLRDGDGQYHSAATALPSDAIGSLDGIGVPVRLAAELGDPYTTHLPADTLLSDEVDLPTYTMKCEISFGPQDFNLLSRLLTAFSVDPYTDSGYTDTSGLRIYKSEAGTLSLSPDGAVHFSAGQSDVGIPCTETDKSELLIALAGAVELLQKAGGDEKAFQYSLLGVTEENGYTFIFGAAAGGVPLMLENKLITGRVTVRDRRIVDAEFLHISATENIGLSAGVLTGRQAYGAFCTGSPAGKALRLVYRLENGVATPVWITTQEEVYSR
ncbi:MAG: hypothetical protein IJC53_08615 [Clostridia bacterium]|nr:hypothetical protein [Clostridia bacterium]